MDLNLRRNGLQHQLPWILTDSVVSILSAVVIAFVAARLMGPVEFGLAATAYLIGSFAEVFVALPFSEAIIQRRNYDSLVADSAFVAMLVTGVATSLILIAIAPLVADLYQAPELTLLVAAQATTCIFLGIRGVPEALMARKLRFKSLAQRNIVAKSSSMMVAIGLVLWGAGAWSIVLSNVAFAAMSMVMILIITPRRSRLRVDIDQVYGLLRFGVFSLLDGLLWSVTPRLYSFLIGRYHGIEAMGYLSVAFRINDAISAILAAVTARVALPIFSVAARERNTFEGAYINGTRLALYVSTPVFIGLAFVSEEVILLFLGESWRPAIVALIAVGLCSTANFARIFAQPAIKAAGRPGYLVSLHVLDIVFILLATMLTSHLSFNQQLWVWIAFGPFYFLVSLVILRLATGFGYIAQLRPMIGPVVAVCGMSLCLWLVSLLLPADSYSLRLIVKILAGALSYLLMLVFVERRHSGLILTKFTARFIS